MIPKTSLRQMAALFERCKMVVTNDNGPMHLAVAVGTRDRDDLWSYGSRLLESWRSEPPCGSSAGSHVLGLQFERLPIAIRN